MDLSLETKNLIKEYKKWHSNEVNKELMDPVIEVDEVASKVAFFYEKVREIVDWKEEHLLRRSAIERILKRRLMFGEKDEMAYSLIVELIRGGHLPNNKILESKSSEIAEIIKKYVFILDKINSNIKEKAGFFNWIIALMAVEIEDCLVPPIKEKALINYMTEIMAQRIKISSKWLKKEPALESKQKVFVFVACQRALFNLDDITISYYLLEKIYSWNNLKAEKLDEFSNRILNIKQKIEKLLNHPLQDKIYNICEKHDTAFLLINDVFSKNINKIELKLGVPSEIESDIRDSYQKRFDRLRSSLKRAAVYATLSIFLSKMLLALAIELPIDKLFGDFNYQSLAINIFFPPLLMAFLVLSIKPPKPINLQKALIEVMKLIHGGKKETYVVKKPVKLGFLLGSVIFSFYTLSFLISFGFIFWLLLKKLNFTLLSSIIFVIFLSLISFAGIRLRQRFQELTIEQEKTGLLTTIIDIFSLPILRVGKWLSYEWQKHNFLSVFFNVLIDMPFQTFVEFLEQLRYFIKQKKQEIK